MNRYTEEIIRYAEHEFRLYTNYITTMKQRLINLTGQMRQITLYGEFNPQVESRLRDGWLSVCDYWALHCNIVSPFTGTQAYFGCLYQIPLQRTWRNRSKNSWTQEQRLNLGIQREGRGKIVIGDLERAVGQIAMYNVTGNKYDVWRSAEWDLSHSDSGSANRTLTNVLAQIAGETSIHADDRVFLSALTVFKFAMQNFIVRTTAPLPSKKEVEAILKPSKEHWFNNSFPNLHNALSQTTVSQLLGLGTLTPTFITLPPGSP